MNTQNQENKNPLFRCDTCAGRTHVCDECSREACPFCDEQARTAKDDGEVLAYVICGPCVAAREAKLQERIAQREARAEAFRMTRAIFKAMTDSALDSGDPRRIREAHEVAAHLLRAAVSR